MGVMEVTDWVTVMVTVVITTAKDQPMPNLILVTMVLDTMDILTDTMDTVTIMANDQLMLMLMVTTGVTMVDTMDILTVMVTVTGAKLTDQNLPFLTNPRFPKKICPLYPG